MLDSFGSLQHPRKQEKLYSPLYRTRSCTASSLWSRFAQVLKRQWTSKNIFLVTQWKELEAILFPGYSNVAVRLSSNARHFLPEKSANANNDQIVRARLQFYPTMFQSQMNIKFQMTPKTFHAFCGFRTSKLYISINIALKGSLINSEEFTWK